MKILVIGGGGREHAICEKVAESNFASICFWAPGNEAIGASRKIKPINILASETEHLIRFSKDNAIDLIIPGPEDALYSGLVNEAKKEKIRIFGPDQGAAALEESKVYAKCFMKRHNIPTASFVTANGASEALTYAARKEYPLVVKASGPALGKGVYVCNSFREAEYAIDEIMVGNKFGEAGRNVIIEDCLVGEEASYIIMVDARGNVRSLASSQDHKRAFDGDKGPNTGGMGAYSPAPVVTPEVEEKILSRIVYPTIKGMKKEKRPFIGFLYFGLMIDENGDPWLLEYNVRLGDPETQVILPRMMTDFVWLIQQALIGNLNNCQIKWDPRPAVCVVLASQGYPITSTKGAVISGIKYAKKTGASVYFAGIALNEKSQIITDGGRVLNITAKGNNFAEAQRNAYAAAKAIRCEKLFYRTDIANRAVEWERRK